MHGGDVDASAAAFEHDEHERVEDRGAADRDVPASPQAPLPTGDVLAPGCISRTHAVLYVLGLIGEPTATSDVVSILNQRGFDEDVGSVGRALSYLHAKGGVTSVGRAVYVLSTDRDQTVTAAG